MSSERGPKPGLARRALLGVAGAGLVAARASDDLPPNVPSWMKTQGAPILRPPYGLPSPFERRVVRRQRMGARTPTLTAASSQTPLQDVFGIVTPNGLHFERHHAGVPAIDPDRHRLMVHGLVERPLIFTMDDLMRFPSVSRLHFLECSGNTPWGVLPANATVQDSHGLLSCCEWTGVPLSTLLAEAGVRPQARWILAEGADAAGMSRSLPIAKALDDVLVAYGQNGERLRPEQGYPLRLFVPGYEGNVSVKWLRRLKVGDAPFETREETSRYTDLMPDGRARQFTFLMDTKSVITAPSGGQRLAEHGPLEISGLAWSGRGRIVQVDVSVDGGARWRRAELQTPVLSKCLTRFRLPWRWDGAPARLMSRALDEAGGLQPRRDALIAERGLNSGYHNNGIQEWLVGTDGAVTHAV